jgi:anthranilate phosphoribosyltransferase
MLDELTTALVNGENLSFDDMTHGMNEILTGQHTDEVVAKFLQNLTNKGETDDELLAMLDKMNELSVHVSPNCNGKIIDMCGTGGDNLKTFNISTAASFVVAAAGGRVAKHGNRSISGVSGSADIFEYFGLDLTSEPSKIVEMIEKFGIGFMFAQKFHPAMKNVANARKIIGGRTAFNLLGPLSSPAQVKNQMIGIFSEKFLQRIISILQKRGSETIMSVRSVDGMDELSTTSNNKICLLKDNTITNFTLNPQEYGLERGVISDIQINTKQDAIESFVNVLNNNANKTMIDITALNAAGGLIVSGICDKFSDGIELALQTITSGKSFDKLREFTKYCNGMEKLEGVGKS